jgi:hypothetical protein
VDVRLLGTGDRKAHRLGAGREQQAVIVDLLAAGDRDRAGARVRAARADGEDLRPAARQQHFLIADMTDQHAAVAECALQDALRQIGSAQLCLVLSHLSLDPGCSRVQNANWQATIVPARVPRRDAFGLPRCPLNFARASKPHDGFSPASEMQLRRCNSESAKGFRNRGPAASMPSRA